MHLLHVNQPHNIIEFVSQRLKFILGLVADVLEYFGFLVDLREILKCVDGVIDFSHVFDNVLNVKVSF